LRANSTNNCPLRPPKWPPNGYRQIVVNFLVLLVEKNRQNLQILQNLENLEKTNKSGKIVLQIKNRRPARKL